MKNRLTLVELLIIIGIIGVSLALILPMLAKMSHTNTVKLLTEKVKVGQVLSVDEQRQLNTSVRIITDITDQDYVKEVNTALIGLHKDLNGYWVRDPVPTTAEAPVTTRSPLVSFPVSYPFWVGDHMSYLIVDGFSGNRFMLVEDKGTDPNNKCCTIIRLSGQDSQAPK